MHPHISAYNFAPEHKTDHGAIICRYIIYCLSLFISKQG
jgi:hypothetical protein